MSAPVRIASLVALQLGLAGCATTGAAPAGSGSGKVEGAMSRPFRDLGLMREVIPAPLAKAYGAPYAIDDPVACPALSAEIASLNAVLRPDVDDIQPKAGSAAGDMLFDAFQGALDLPFRGALRRLSGAEGRDRARAAAVLAGMVRRGWLKGVAHEAGCPPAPLR